MELWQGDLVSQIQSAENEESAFKKIEDEALALGFENAAYGLRLNLNITNQKVVMMNNYSQNWKRRYTDENYISIDPVVKHGNKSLMPVVWSSNKITENKNFWEDAYSHNLKYGWSQASADQVGRRGLLTLTRGHEPISELELKELQYRLTWLTQISHHCMSEIITTKKMPETMITLTMREKDVLRWTAAGKTSGETSTIMNITERTVNFHIANSMQKLNCINKTSATVRAAMLGLLD
ncbi:autoinducer binding domain-containing protein [Halothiobacillus neapolitanus]|uniref:Transcriptional regulator, LuxR family n=1 Tax=Halothiobacillus neapolitanus (strain ATCC 23641 / DSM 15147 / CIP 104769 / NCIMB 8539 / c2) TaxID=555778 RepID=D0KZC8_HALNC|nr:autoinducer binding domain-containing protein [Halothiobacillus neapolitanus]ACX95801.1 transcriptional regulator, LuxR family [Halothiobacillus neapolitanus c2]TDN66111.1 LuxR family transcriptional regulator [Halothiobacillus neapolitanus]